MTCQVRLFLRTSDFRRKALPAGHLHRFGNAPSLAFGSKPHTEEHVFVGDAVEGEAEVGILGEGFVGASGGREDVLESRLILAGNSSRPAMDCSSCWYIGGSRSASRGLSSSSKRG